MALVPLSGQTVFSGGYPVEAARLLAFEAGTSTPRQFYLTSDLDPQKLHPNPIVASDGSWPVMFAGVGDYDIRITDAKGVQFRTLLGLPGEKPASLGGSATLDPLRLLPTGTLVPIYAKGRRAGFVRANGGTIGSAASDASERANDDAHDLFVHLYVQDPNLAVSGGRASAGAEADWAANKTIVLPDLQGRFPLGVLDAGNAGASAGRMDGAALGTGAVLGGAGGAGAHKLLENEMPSHSHANSASCANAGAHTPTGTIGPAGGHFHPVRFNNQATYGSGGLGAANTVGQTPNNTNGNTDSVGDHNHGLTMDQVGPHAHTVTVAIAGTGGSQVHNNVPPFLALTFYLKL